MAVPSSLNDNNIEDSSSVIAREVFYKNCFMLDGKPMPIPNSWQVDPKILTRDSKRKLSTGALWAPYICTVYTVTWTYKYLSSKDYKTLYDAYIKSVSKANGKKGSIKHYIATMDSNSKDSVFCTPCYTEDGFKAPLYRIDPITKEHYYKDVVFTIVSLGGPDDKTNYFTKRSSFQNTASKLNYGNYVDVIKNKYSSVEVVDNEEDTTNS